MTITKDVPNLDILRTFAVLSVLLGHFYTTAWPNQQHNEAFHNLGVGGVCFFFVHTCLVLFGSLERTRTKHPARDFYIRRAFRIYPLCWVAVLATILTGLTDIPAQQYELIGRSGKLANFLLVQNFTRGGSVLGPLWSLPWEVQMYLALPPLFFLLRASKRPAANAILAWVVLTAIAIASTALPLPHILHAMVYPPMFFGGIIAYFLSLESRPRIPAWTWPLAVLCFLLLRNLLLRGTELLDPHNVAINAAICLLVGLSIPWFRNVKSPWITGPALWIARYSYGIYLGHMLVLMFLQRHAPDLPLAAKAAAYVFLTLAVAVAGYHAIEHPLILAGKKVAQRLDRTTPVTALPGRAE